MKNNISSKNLQDNKQLYAQVSKGNIKKIFKIKDAFSKLSLNKISKMYNVMNNSNQKGKPKINTYCQHQLMA